MLLPRKEFAMARKRYSDEDCLKVLREKENQRLKKIVAELELDKSILKETVDFLKPRG